MNASLSAALVVLLVAGGWLLGRRRTRPFLRSTDTTAVVALNRAQIERLRDRPEPSPEAPSSLVRLRGPEAIAAAAAVPVALSRQRLHQLQAAILGSREQRLAAIAEASRSGRRELLPLLRRALRDPDPVVMAAAAAAIDRFRGRTAAQPGGAPSARRVRRSAEAPFAVSRSSG